jgi:hypothetical protein
MGSPGRSGGFESRLLHYGLQLVFVQVEPGFERLQVRVQLPYGVQLAVAGEGFVVLGVELEHVGDFDGHGEAEGAVLVPGVGLVGDLFAEGGGEGGCVLVAGEVVGGDADGFADEVVAALEDAECCSADVGGCDSGQWLVGEREGEDEFAELVPGGAQALCQAVEVPGGAQKGGRYAVFGEQGQRSSLG